MAPDKGPERKPHLLSSSTEDCLEAKGGVALVKMRFKV